MIPLGDVIFGQKKGIITDLATSEPVKEKSHSLLESITPHIPSPSEWLGIKDKLKEIAEDMHQKALLTPNPEDDKIDFLQYMYDYADHSAPLAKLLPTWCKDFMLYFTSLFNTLAHDSVQYVFKHVYKFVTEIVLFTPEWLFNNDWFPVIVSKYSYLSIGVVVVFAMIEGIKRMFGWSHTKITDTLKKLPLALAASASTPFLFTNGLKLLNKVTDLILKLSSDTIGSTDMANSIFTMSLVFEPVNILMMIIFLLIVCFLCVPMILLHARRWFNLTALGIITPLAVSCWLFRSTEGYFHMWLRGLKNSSLVQLAYATFVSILGVLMFATPNPVTIEGIFAKSMIFVGGIHCLAHPPQFIKRFDEGGDPFKQFKQLKEYGTNKYERYNEYKGKSEDWLVKGAEIAGKGYRLIFKK